MTMTREVRVAVVGGGIGGLACAQHLTTLGFAPGSGVLVLESDAVPGGKIRTAFEPPGFAIEWGPQTCFLEPDLVALAREVGVTLEERPKAERARFLVRGGRLRSPLGAMGVRGWLRLLWGLVRRGAPPGEDESVHDYARRRFGDEAARRLFDALVSGTYAGDPARLSFSAALARFGQRRAPSGHVRGGMGALPLAIAKALGPGLRTGARVAALSPAAAGTLPREGTPGYRLSLEGGAEVHAAHVVLAIPAFAAAPLVRAVDASLATLLDGIPYGAVTAVSLGYDEAAFPRGRPRGFGFLAPREEGLPILGVLYCPAPPGHVLLRVMLAGALGEATARERAEGALASLLAPARPPIFARTISHPRGIPQYERGHLARLREIDARLALLPGLHVAGNAYRGIAVPDVVADARGLARRIAEAGR